MFYLGFTGLILLLALGIGGGIYYYLTFFQEKLTGSLNKSNKLITIFDFDGTICDSLEVGIQAYNDISYQYKVSPIPIENLDEYRHIGTQTFMKSHGVTWWKLPCIVHQMKNALKTKMVDLNTFDGIHDVISMLKNQDVTVGILTSNKFENVEIFLKKNDLLDFDFIYHGSSVFGKSRLIKKIIRKFGHANILYVGDEVRDIEACQKIGVPIVSVSWGYQSQELLSSHSPDYLVASTEELKRLLVGLLKS